MDPGPVNETLATHRSCGHFWPVHLRVVLAGPKPYKLQELINEGSEINLTNPGRNWHLQEITIPAGFV